MPAKSIPKFCTRNDMSRSRYYTLRAEELGPREMNNGSRVVISDEAESEWRLQMEVLTLIVDLPEGKEADVRAAVQMWFPREDIPNGIWAKAWAHAPARRARRAERDAARRTVINNRQEARRVRAQA